MEKSEKDLENKQEMENQKKGIQKDAINKKQNESDGREINHQVEQRKEQHQPRDNA